LWKYRSPVMFKFGSQRKLIQSVQRLVGFHKTSLLVSTRWGPCPKLRHADQPPKFSLPCSTAETFSFTRRSCGIHYIGTPSFVNKAAKAYCPGLPYKCYFPLVGFIHETTRIGCWRRASKFIKPSS